MLKNALVVGGSSGIGLAAVFKLLDEGYNHVFVVSKTDYPQSLAETEKNILSQKTTLYKIDLVQGDYEVFDSITEIDTLLITAGFGRVALFENLTPTEIKNLVLCNTLSTIQIIKKYYDKIKSDNNFYCGVMVSIAGHVASPYFSVYGASKAALKMFIENVNTELSAGGYKNRILDVSPGSLKSTSFNGSETNISELNGVVCEILKAMKNHETLYIPDFEKTYSDVLERYHQSPQKFAIESYDYKANSDRINTKPQVCVGYLSGTFDLFHIGHLNLLRRAKQMCDYLIVGVHKSGSWKGKQTFIPFEERLEIVKNIRYVDMAVESFTEDADAWEKYYYDKLFVGSDYKGTERFNRYEAFFADKGVEICYFPYTQGTSSTQLRDAISQKIDKKSKTK